MKKIIRISSLILRSLVIAFFAVSIFYAIDINPDTISPQPLIEIEKYTNVPKTHGDDQSYNCSKCHYEPLYAECTDCHIPDYWIGDDDGTYMAHHDLSYNGFIDCWSVDCHNPPNPNDIRFVKTNLLDGGDWQEFCYTKCHNESELG
ncbi:MAG: hypothetical protein AYK22_00535 [Thermoplasmatales archaeon SG8-52-3]|nr:MAG: hypothetical protein AYK22_00535 [Thermoplasmatales archaeon SG8-52-3]